MHSVLYLSRGKNIGGSQRQIFNVIKNLDRNLFNPIVVCKEDGQFVDFLRDNQIETHVLKLRPWRKFPVSALRYLDLIRLTKLAYSMNVSVIHSSDLWLNPYLTHAARLLNIPSVLHVRAPVTGRDIYKHGFRRASSIVAISRRVRSNLIDGGIPQEKIALIDDSVDVETFAAESHNNNNNILRKQFRPIGKTLIGIVGRIDGFKKQIEFVKAASKTAKKASSAVSFFIIGPTHSDDYCQRLNRCIRSNRMENNIFLTGSRDDMPAVISSLDILVSLSGGSVMFEAMAAGKPVISAGFSKIANSVHIQNERTGILIESSENDLLASAMLRLTEDVDLRRQLGSSAMDWAMQRLCHKRMAARTQQLYVNVLNAYKDRMPLQGRSKHLVTDVFVTTS
jgi:glycosyltransferase involved in cell wall biosynthesis